MEVRFIDQEDATTCVEIEHRGWERLSARGEARRDRNRAGWSAVLPSLIAAATGA